MAAKIMDMIEFGGKFLQNEKYELFLPSTKAITLSVFAVGD
jgi:hypothetical protein